MTNVEEIKSALKRLESNSETDADRQMLVKALREKVITIESDQQSVAVGGDVGNSVIVTGSGNVVHVIRPAIAEALVLASTSAMADPAGRWATPELTNPFDQNDKYMLHFDLKVKGNTLLGAITKVSTTKRYTFTKGILDGKIEGNVISFYSVEQSLSWERGGEIRTTYRDYYYGSVSKDQIEFTLTSDRPWGFPPQEFTAKREKTGH
jgi:hypothetical protein